MAVSRALGKRCGLALLFCVACGADTTPAIEAAPDEAGDRAGQRAPEPPPDQEDVATPGVPDLPSAEPEPAAETELDAETTGRLCVKPYAVDESPGKGAQPRPGRGPDTEAERDRQLAKQAAQHRRLSRGLQVSVDAQPAQAWNERSGGVFAGLDLGIKHRVAITDVEGRKVKSLTLGFLKRESQDVCLALSSFYGTWQLRGLKAGSRCGPCVGR